MTVSLGVNVRVADPGGVDVPMTVCWESGVRVTDSNTGGRSRDRHYEGGQTCTSQGPPMATWAPSRASSRAMFCHFV